MKPARVVPAAQTGPLDEARLARLLIAEAMRQVGIEPPAVAPEPAPTVRLGQS